MNLKPNMNHLLKKILMLKDMKTSNKLLIALAISLILIPIIVIAVNVKMNYKDSNTFYKNLKENTELNAPLYGYVANEFPEFSAVNVNDGNNAYINFVVLKSDKAGIKIPVDLKALYDIKVDEHNVLQFILKNTNKKLKYNLTVYIYSNHVKSFNLAKAAGFILDIKSDSVQLNITDVKRVSFHELTSIGSLTVKANKVGDLRFDNEKNSNVAIELNNSNFSSLRSPFQSLNIRSVGQSNIDIFGDLNDRNKYKIDHLYIKTAGNTDLKVGNIKINNSSGNLSDSTSVSMSASILKTMFNK